MKTVQQYLEECKEKAWYNRYVYSKTYAMDTPREGYEDEYAEAVRDCEIVEELLKMNEAKSFWRADYSLDPFTYGGSKEEIEHAMKAVRAPDAKTVLDRTLTTISISY